MKQKNADKRENLEQINRFKDKIRQGKGDEDKEFDKIMGKKGSTPTFGKRKKVIDQVREKHYQKRQNQFKDKNSKVSRKAGPGGRGGKPGGKKQKSKRPGKVARQRKR